MSNKILKLFLLFTVFIQVNLATAQDSKTEYGKKIVSQLDAKSQKLIKEKWRIEKKLRDIKSKVKGLIVSYDENGKLIVENHAKGALVELMAQGFSYEAAKKERNKEYRKMFQKKDELKFKLGVIDSKIKTRHAYIKKQFIKLVRTHKGNYPENKRSFKKRKASYPRAYECVNDNFLEELNLSYVCFQNALVKGTGLDSRVIGGLTKMLIRDNELTKDKAEFLLFGIEDKYKKKSARRYFFQSMCTVNVYHKKIEVNQQSKILLRACAKYLNESAILKKQEKTLFCLALSKSYQTDISEFNILSICDQNQESNVYTTSFESCYKNIEKNTGRKDTANFFYKNICSKLPYTIQDLIAIDDFYFCRRYTYNDHEKCEQADSYIQNKEKLEAVTKQRKKATQKLKLLPPVKMTLDMVGGVIETTIETMIEAGAHREQ